MSESTSRLFRFTGPRYRCGCLLHSHNANTVAFVFEGIGGFCVARTRDLRIKSPLLYQLS